MPPVPAKVVQEAQRYSAVAGHGFVEWHPQRREMLVVHRAAGASTTQLWRLAAPLAPLEPLTEGNEPVTNARWEPNDGRYIVFGRATGGDEAFQLYRLDPTTRATVQITEPGQRHQLIGWSKVAAGRTLAVVMSVPLDRTAEGGRREQIVTRLWLLDPLDPSHNRTLAELPGSGWSDPKVSPDHTQLALTRFVSAAESEAWLVDLHDGRRRQLLPTAAESLKASHFVEEWAADGKSLYVTSDRAGEFLELMRLELTDLATDRPTLPRLMRLTQGIPWDITASSESPHRRSLAMIVNNDGRDELRLLDPRSGSAQALPPMPAGSVTRAEFHRSLGDLALVVNSAQGPAQIHVIDPERKTVAAWTRPIGTEGLDLESLPAQQIVRWPAFDGRTISGILSLPPARFGGRRPVLMLVHGGPEAQSKQGWHGRWNYFTQVLGVAVLEPNVRGSSGYGKTFLALDNGRLREDSVKDMGSAIDWMAGQPRLDPKRVLVVGGSYGGYMALAASTLLPDRIAGAASTVGISNFVSFLENTETYRRDLRRVEYGDERDPAMRAFLQSISPLNHAARITKPLFVAQGKNDPRVPWTESEQIVRSLQSRNTPVWYLLADNEGHGFARRENADYWFAALIQFARQTLKP
ncbi:MAG TPA: alpha/beta fold hydrolase [Rubrivivax sp.]|nr:alpha/beta fold hydrolase [Rubrivivax sp.]